jgi:hypothetical protein
MKRNFQLIRKLLLMIESDSNGIDVVTMVDIMHNPVQIGQ